MTFPTSRLDELDPEAKRALVAKLLQDQLKTADVEAPLTYGQHAMWFLHELIPENFAYNVAFTARVRSSIDVEVLKNALQSIMDRHAPLRTTYSRHEGKSVQVIHSSLTPTLNHIDAAGWDEATLYQAVRSAYEVPFDLEQGPVFRVHLFTRAAEDHVLLLCAHHIAIDGWSVWILLQELGEYYAAAVSGVDADLPPLATQYLDYVSWEAESLAGAEGERLWNYWGPRLRGELPVLDLPADYPRPAVQTCNGATLPFEFGPDLGERIRALARSEQTTVYAVLLAAYQVLLHRYSGQDDILVGSPMAGRSQPQFAGLVGDFINVVVLRGDLSGAPRFRDFLAQVRETVLGALAHQDYPFALLVNRLAPKLDPSRSPIFQVVLNFQNIQRASDLAELFVPGNTEARVDVGGLLLEPYSMPQQEGQLDLMLQVIDASGVLFGSFQYNTDLFGAATIERMAGHYRTLLESIVADPDCPVNELPLLTPADRHQILVDWNDTAVDFPTDRCVHQLIEEQVARTPERIAVTFDGEQLTYRELNERANRLAHHLVRQGVGPEALVGIYLERSPNMIVSVLAVHKAGGAYVPLDPTYPTERLRLMLEDAEAAVLITDQSVRLDHLAGDGSWAMGGEPVQVVNLDLDWPDIAGLESTNLGPTASPENLAYIIHTSGSTGRPKGIEIEHRSLVDFLYAFQQTPGMTRDDVVLARTTLSFDPSIVEVFLPLITGAQIALVDSQTSANGASLRVALATSGATILQLTPSHCRLLLAAGWEGTPGLKLLVGGEALTRDLVQELLPRVGELWNIYGPTETTVWSTAEHVTSADRISVGRPIPNVEVYILGSGGKPAPVGVVGELHIAGPGLARGYRNRPDLTAQSFVWLDRARWRGIGPEDTDLGSGSIRMYRSGDLGRYLPDGRIELLGRSDHQLKVRGFRIEAGEIEVALTQIEGIQAAVVIAREDTPGNQRLVAYVQPQAGVTPSPAVMRRELKQRLPGYMVPAVFVPLAEFPLTPTGKVDRRALPAPEQRRSTLDNRYAAPRTPTEQMVAKVWGEVLQVDRVGVYDNYFDLGGDSLRLIEALGAIEERIGVRLNPSQAQTQTLGQLAAVCDEMVARGEVRIPPPPAQSGGVVRAMRRILGARS